MAKEVIPTSVRLSPEQAEWLNEQEESNSELICEAVDRLREERSDPDVPEPDCGICGDPVSLADAKSGFGRVPVHPECFREQISANTDDDTNDSDNGEEIVTDGGHEFSMSDALPHIPLTESLLEDVANHERITTVWVPENPPDTVYTLDGEHKGNILQFFIETPDRYIPFHFEPSADLLLSWYQKKPTYKHSDAHEEITALRLVEETIKNEYRPLTDTNDGQEVKEQ